MSKQEEKKKTTEAMYNLIFEKINDDPTLMDHVHNMLDTFIDKKRLHPKYAQLWKNILKERSLDQIKEMLLKDDENGEILRSTTPFLGIISQEERKNIIRSNLGSRKP